MNATPMIFNVEKARYIADHQCPDKYIAWMLREASDKIERLEKVTLDQLDTLEDQLAVLEGLNDHASAEECEDALDNAKENLRDVIALAKGESK